MHKPAGTAMNYDELRGAIAQRHRALSGRLQQIAEFVLDHPTDVALGTVAEIAERSGVPPSAIVRFAHALGFDGFTQMQQVFRSRLVAGVAPSYKARLARMKSEEKSILGRKPAAVLGRFVAEAQSSLVALSQSAHEHQLDAAIKTTLENPQVQEKLSKAGFTAAPLSTSAFAEFIRSQAQTYEQAFKAANIALK